jgi:hypothetical protein
VAIQVSGDNSTWKEVAAMVAGAANSGAYQFAYEVPPGVMYIRAVVSGNTGQAVDCECFVHEFTSIA